MPNPKTTNINWTDFGSDAQTMVNRLDRATEHLNSKRSGGFPRYRRADALRAIILQGLEAIEADMAQADAGG